MSNPTTEMKWVVGRINKIEQKKRCPHGKKDCIIINQTNGHERVAWEDHRSYRIPVQTQGLNAKVIPLLLVGFVIPIKTSAATDVPEARPRGLLNSMGADLCSGIRPLELQGSDGTSPHVRWNRGSGRKDVVIWRDSGPAE